MAAGRLPNRLQRLRIKAADKKYYKDRTGKMKITETGNKKFCGIILAGGKSRRMGVDKAELTLDGMTFLEIQVRKLQLLGAADIMISGKTTGLPGTRSVMDIYPGCGPLGGLYSCFVSASQTCALVLSVDVPLISPSTLEELLETHFRDNYDATILARNGRIEPLIAVYNTDTAGLLAELIENRKLAVRAYIDRLHYRLYSYNGSPAELFNCNFPEDLAALTAHLTAGE